MWWRGAFSGAQALGTSGADVIAGFAAAIHEAKRVRDMRKYPFWARGAGYIETMRLPAPGKILRDSPTRQGHAQIIGERLMVKGERIDRRKSYWPKDQLPKFGVNILPKRNP